LEGVPTAVVQRTDIAVTLRAGGKVASRQETRIECELENVLGGQPGHGAGANGASVLIWIIPEGTVVRPGDVIARLDASEYEDLVQQQEVKVEASRGQAAAAEQDLKTAKLALVEFRDGLLKLQASILNGQLVTAEANVDRARDRVAWAGRMVAKKYLAPSQAFDDERARVQAETQFETARTQLETFRKYTGPTTLRSLEVAADVARAEAQFQRGRLVEQELQLKRFRRLVDRCTIRAPHDGMVVYATKGDGTPRVFEGAIVRQHQRLFLLPDPSQMEVQALLNETIVNRVRPGMAALVTVESMPAERLEARVEAIAPLALTSTNPFYNNDVKNYIGYVRVLRPPAWLRPGMTAEVEIVTDRRPKALVVPPGAVAFEGGREFCFVAEPDGDGVEKRPVAVEPASPNFLEVTEGLKEGEQVVLDPDHLGPDVEVNDAPALDTRR
jgi:HlyD family secretion protein